MTIDDFQKTVVQEALRRVSHPDLNAEKLLMGTAVHESGGLKFTRQIGGGPARGYFQMEGATHDDCWANYLAFRHTLAAKVRTCLLVGQEPTADILETNHLYAAAMARVRYMRAPGAIPSTGDGIAKYWKDNYNTIKGAGTVGQFKQDWNLYLTDTYGAI